MLNFFFFYVILSYSQLGKFSCGMNERKKNATKITYFLLSSIDFDPLISLSSDICVDFTNELALGKFRMFLTFCSLFHLNFYVVQLCALNTNEKTTKKKTTLIIGKNYSFSLRFGLVARLLSELTGKKRLTNCIHWFCQRHY